MNLSAISITVGLVALLAAWLILFRSGIIFGINAWIRNRVFTDKWLIYSRRRLALLFFGLGIIALFSGMDALVDEKNLSADAIQKNLNQAEVDFQKRAYKNVVSKSLEVVKSQPKNIKAWELLAGAWWTLGEERKALSAIEIIKGIDPNFPIKNSPILLSIETKAKKSPPKKAASDGS